MPLPEFKQNDNNMAFVYARYSSHSQNEQSIQQQLDAAKEFADKHGLNIVERYCDPAHSGTDSNRPKYNEMLGDVKKVKPAYCIMWKFDRLARDVHQAVYAKRIMHLAGCKVVSITEPVDVETPEGRMFGQMLDIYAEFYASQAQVNIKRGMNHNAKNCFVNGSVKYGYKGNPDTKRYEIDEEQARIVTEIYQRYDAGERFTDIAEDLNGRGYRTLRDKPWRTDSLAKIIKNPTYKGIYIWKDHVIPDGMPRIVSDELWNRCFERLQANKNHRREGGKEVDYWLTPKVKCGKCGEVMSGAYTTGTHRDGTKGNRYYYYRCTNKNCEVGNISKPKLEEAVKNIIRIILNDDNNMAGLTADAYLEYQERNRNKNKMKELNAKLADIKKRENNLMDAIEQGGFAPQIQDKLLTLNEQRIGVENEIAIEKAKDELAQTESIKDYIEKKTNVDIDNIEELKDLFEHFVIELRFIDNTVVALCRLATGVNYVEFTDWEDFVIYPENAVEGQLPPDI